MTGPVRSVAVVGGGTAAWIAAIALHRAFAPTGLSVRVIVPPATVVPDTPLSALPDLARFHRLLGIAERDLLVEADACFALGQAFAGWSGDEATFLHAYGETGRPIGLLPFVQSWRRAAAGGLAAPFEAFCRTAAAARAGRMPTDGTPTHGYQLDARRYVALLRRRAVSLGIAVMDDTVSVERGPAGVEALHLPGGGRIDADLYVDATDRDALLIGPADDSKGDAFPSPVTRLLTAWGPRLDPLPLYPRIAAHPHGWIGLFPLARRTGIVMALGEEMASGAARDALPRLAGLPIVGDIAEAPLRSHRRRRPWIGNCVAVGGAACDGDPIDAATLQREQIAVAQLVALFPVDRTDMAEAAIYNAEVTAHHDRLRDFQAAHYRLNRRHGEPFWDAARALPVSDDLRERIALFQARGMVAEYNHESFHADSWQAVMIGHGVMPRAHDPLADRVPEAEVAGAMQALLAAIRRDVERMPAHAQARAAALR